jgi:hypothetical protein
MRPGKQLLFQVAFGKIFPAMKLFYILKLCFIFRKNDNSSEIICQSWSSNFELYLKIFKSDLNFVNRLERNLKNYFQPACSLKIIRFNSYFEFILYLI